MRYNRKSITIITAAVNPVVSTSDMKDYLRVDTSDDDDLIASFVSAATEMIKQYCKRSFVTETLEFTMDGFGTSDGDEALLRMGAGVHTISYPYLLGQGEEVDIPFAPIQSITSVKYFTRDNAENTYSANNYQLDEFGGRIYLNEGESWPDNLRDREAVKIRYVSGYGDNASDIPAPIIQAIKQYVGKMYDCREACEIPSACKKLLAPYKLHDSLGWG